MTTKTCKKCKRIYKWDDKTQSYISMPVTDDYYCTHDWQEGHLEPGIVGTTSPLKPYPASQGPTMQEPQQQFREIQPAPKAGKISVDKIQRAIESVSKRKGEPKMPIKFIPEYEENEILTTFNMVLDNQFFLNYAGDLCQKIGATAFTIIATDKGIPHAAYRVSIPEESIIQRILPKIKKIEF